MSTLALRGRITELEKKRDGIGTKLRALNRSINMLTQEGIICAPEDINADSIASLAGNLAEQRREYREVIDMIRELEGEL